MYGVDLAWEVGASHRETYSNIDNTSVIFEIKSILHDLRQGDSTVTEYFNTLTRYWQQLDTGVEVSRRWTHVQEDR